jgi:arylsulfatase A-like enzyme
MIGLHAICSKTRYTHKLEYKFCIREMIAAMNIILLVFDTLRKDSVGVYGTPPWGEVYTPHLNAFAQESVTFTRAYPEVLPTLPARRALYTGQRVYPFFEGDFRLKGDFVGAPGWGPIKENQDTLAELLRDRGGYRTALISDVYHQFKPSKNFTRGFDQWQFLRGQELDPYRSGPEPTSEQIDHWLASELQERTLGWKTDGSNLVAFMRQCLKNMSGREREEDYFNARVMIESARWLEQNRDAENFFLTIECFDPHEPWFVPEHYRRIYDKTNRQEHVISLYDETEGISPELLSRAQANYSALVSMCDRWFGYLYETTRSLGLLENTIFIVMSDHGHSIGDANYIGKRGYPSHPSVYDIALFIRHPDGSGAGTRSDIFLQHTDVSAQILEFAGIQYEKAIHGQAFWEHALEGDSLRDHVTVGWGGAMTVIDEHWWMNCKVNGNGVFLYDLTTDQPFANNVADENPEIVKKMFAIGVEDAGGEFPDYILELAASEADAPGCSALAARF